VGANRLRTALVFSPVFYDHDTGQGHPENSNRLKVIMTELERSEGLLRNEVCALIKPHKAKTADLELVHTKGHVQVVERICRLGGGLLDLGDTVVSPQSYDVARYAVGGALTAVDLVLGHKAENAFSLARPPGHHAGSQYASGFCVFNSIAVAAMHLLKNRGLHRVLILDIDAHHGNGTQEIFYDSREVLYLSLHEDPSLFPGTGFVDEVGRQEGIGFNVNLPFPFLTGDRAYSRAFDEVVIPIARQYQPQFILASVGYDAYEGDPVARLNLSASFFPAMFDKILDLAAKLCENRLVAVLEGGYDLERLGKIAVSTFSKMAKIPYDIPVDDHKEDLGAERKAGKVISKVKETLSVFWNLNS
jgi:acetoin utilization deacetylase AcuC-like enzyme